MYIFTQKTNPENPGRGKLVYMEGGFSTVSRLVCYKDADSLKYRVLSQSSLFFWGGAKHSSWTNMESNKKEGESR